VNLESIGLLVRKSGHLAGIWTDEQEPRARSSRSCFVASVKS